MKFVIKKSEDNQWYYVIQSGNGQIMLVSETMKQKRSCIKAIERIKSYSKIAKVVIED